MLRLRQSLPRHTRPLRFFCSRALKLIELVRTMGEGTQRIAYASKAFGGDYPLFAQCAALAAASPAGAEWYL